VPTLKVLEAERREKGELQWIGCPEQIAFHIVFQDGWQNGLNKLFSAASGE